MGFAMPSVLHRTYGAQTGAVQVNVGWTGISFRDRVA
jgi:hypothetical protein